MDEAQRAIVAVRVSKCREDMATAREDFERGRFRAAVARSYYAMFHITGAALLTIEVERAKHSGVESAFSEFFIKPGHIEPEYGEIYRRGQRFLTRLERYLREVGAIR
ncbi:MAG: hypothetical protein CVU38_16140 [Chloroflexi bacterium HGW-Chloroflexi-1]|nr:MAG: hypothetical protein CVU38_16140 [Chloroflexi bacterium HGW-Chloroflexi-1]